VIAGIINKGQSFLDLKKCKNTIVNTLNQFIQDDKTGYYLNNKILLVQSTLWNDPASKYDPTPYIDKKTDNIILLWGRLTNRKDLGLTFGLNQKELKMKCDSELIHISYLKWGNNLTDYIYGDYSAVVFSPKKNELLCFIDHMGVKPFYYYGDNDIFVFSSTLTLFHRLKLFPVNPDMEWAAKYMLHLSMDFKKTAYADIYKLPPAHKLIVSEKGTRKTKYFSFNGENKLENVTIEECIEQYQYLLSNAIKTRINSDYPVGSETSGGIDSSTITALAAKNFDQPIEKFYTFGFATLEHEPNYILQTSQKYRIKNNYICCSNLSAEFDVVTEKSLDALGYPVEHGNATFHVPFYKECQKNNVRTLLSGFGGDEFVTSIHGDIALKELLINKKYTELYRRLPGSKLTAFLRLLKMYYKLNYSKPDEYNARFLNAWKQRWPYFTVKDGLVKHYSLKQKYFDTAKFDAGYTNLNKFTLEGRFQPFVPTRMNNCTNMAYAYGIDYAWPLLDVKLIEFFLSIPTEFKYSKGMGRYFHRKAVETFVPKGVNWKPGKHMGEPVFDRFTGLKVELNHDLHPDISGVADIPKLRNNIKNTADNKNLNALMPINRSVAAVNLIDLWLKKTYPNGANWQNTP